MEQSNHIGGVETPQNCHEATKVTEDKEHVTNEYRIRKIIPNMGVNWRKCNMYTKEVENTNVCILDNQKEV